MKSVALGIDIGGTKVDAALIDAAGTVVPGSHRRLDTGRKLTRRELDQRVRAVAEHALTARPQDSELCGIGIGSAGPIDSRTSLINPVNMPYAHGADLRAAVSPIAPGVPVRLALDGACPVQGELRVGALRDVRYGMAIVVSTGAGGGVVVNGRVVTGRSGNAGHLGQLRLEPSVPGDPHAGTVEAMASGPRTVAWAREQGWTGEDGPALAGSYSTGDPIAIAAVRRSASAIGRAIAEASTLLPRLSR